MDGLFICVLKMNYCLTGLVFDIWVNRSFKFQPVSHTSQMTYKDLVYSPLSHFETGQTQFSFTYNKLVCKPSCYLRLTDKNVMML